MARLKVFHLTTGQVVTWTELANMFDPLRQVSNGSYIISVSTCEGLHAVTPALQLTGALPFGIVATPYRVDWSDNVVGFAAFYHL